MAALPPNPITFEKHIRAHATLMSVGFLVLLPLGVLIPRFARTFTAKWFYGHLGFQLFLAGPIIIAGFAMGVYSTQLTVNAQETAHFDDPHKKTGLALFILYIIQVVLGLTTHWFKRPSNRLLLHRAPHHILHIAIGLAIIGLAFFQVHLGYTFEWVVWVGAPLVPPSVDKAWMAWVIIIPILYVGGLALLPRQISQESAMRHDRRNGQSSATALRKEEASA